MKNNTATVQRQIDEATHNSPVSNEAAERAFLSELTSLSQKYRLGIAGAPVLFQMEWDDDERLYTSDSEGHLFFR